MLRDEFILNISLWGAVLTDERARQCMIYMLRSVHYLERWYTFTSFPWVRSLVCSQNCISYSGANSPFLLVTMHFSLGIELKNGF
jgi:hypothetical protein